VVCSMVFSLHPRDYREEMRRLIIGISEKARLTNSDFIVIPQNSVILMYTRDGVLHEPFASHISGIGHEPLFSKNFPQEISHDVRELQKVVSDGFPVWTIEYAANYRDAKKLVNDNKSNQFVTFVAEKRSLDSIPSDSEKLFTWSSKNIESISMVRNFLYLINPHRFKTLQAFEAAIQRTNFDAVVIDAYFMSRPITKETVQLLKKKQNGNRRLVLAYMSIGEAEDYRYYWRSEWNTKRPAWIVAENKKWKGNYSVRFWDKKWHAILYKNVSSYIDKIVAAGFDGVYLDTIDVFMRFERGDL